jgi:hypothetical protein
VAMVTACLVALGGGHSAETATTLRAMAQNASSRLSGP